ncbi:MULTISPECIES: signal recognition particle subunit SRP19/SEC65 family protein [Methanothermobacter]|uniref:signal recognition particle subunit SRP19/SEC65 family protein n=1 Tax=Methanothermobacter TaxID=145260 RepID=UPI000E22D9F6|nr:MULTISPECIES: signal recognition particle subunit SRP19/SEC65 family protein [Methanothermobacter]NLU04719.1 signal recognition particle protein Srp19 [Methanothermobacter sp.]WBF06492.1 signal recognition particle protein Srp19 [Methanothermobacter thermautotrophicus]WBF08286.1 signal recognition particle protein Srp19 [Methanothermobacter thermautotrophicus]HOQ18028.1 signal recognition particle subunit SRP19/SEC65 family protein [Methanothermobacter thermautotrophicus]
MNLIIWPAYLDSRKSRSEGRRVPLEYAVESPTASEILRAARKLQLEASMESDRAYPPSWWESSGRVVVEYNGKKSELLPKIARLVRSSRKR